MGLYKNFLNEKVLAKGAFHRWLGKSEDEPITAADIAKGKAAGGHAEKMAVQAQNFREEIQVDETISKNKMFKGDSKKQRIKRALGAYYGKKNEEVVNEASPVTGTRVISRHGIGQKHHAEVRYNKDYEEYSVHHYKDGKHVGEGPVSYHGSGPEGRADAQSTADHEVVRLNSVKEELEPIIELSISTHHKYRTASSRDEGRHRRTELIRKKVYGLDDSQAKEHRRVADNRNRGIMRSQLSTAGVQGYKTTKEEVEQLDEMMPIKDHPYHKKSDAELHYIMKDAHKAAAVVQGHDTAAHMKYLDQVNDAGTVMAYRRKGGKRVVEDVNEARIEKITRIIGKEVITEKKTNAKELIARAEKEASKKAQAASSKSDGMSYIEALKAALRRIKGRKNIRQTELGIKEEIEVKTINDLREEKLEQHHHDALKRYAASNGRTWKSKLNTDWEKGHTHGDDTASIRQVRNLIGPSGLQHYKLKEDVDLTEGEHEVVKHDNYSTWKKHAAAVGAEVALHGTPGVKKAVKHGHIYGMWHFNKGWMNHIGIKEEMVTPTIIAEGMSDAAHELVLHADNDAHLHRSSHQPIIANLKKAKKGTYDSEKAKKLWKYHADRAAQSYHKAHGDSSQHWSKAFTTKDRHEAAAHWEEHHRHEVHND